MGQLESKEHNLLVHLLHSMIKARGHDIKLGQVREFLQIVHELCPWVSEGGILDEKAWGLVGEKIGHFCSDNNILPQTAILTTVWSKLRKCLPFPITFCSLLSSSCAFSGCRSRSPGSCSSFFVLFCPAPYQAQASFEPESSNFPPAPPEQKEIVERGSCSRHSEYDFNPCDVPLTEVSNKRGFSDVDNMFPCLFPVVEVPDAQGQIIRRYHPVPPKTLRELKEAVAQYGPTAPYTMSLLETLTGEALLPHDWGCLAKAGLPGGDCLLWRADYDDRAYAQAQRNRTYQIPITLDMLLGKGQFEDLNAQIQLPEMAFGQINTIALRACKQLPSIGVKTKELAKIKQGPDEPYQDFVSHLLQAVGRLVQDGEAGTLLVKQLAYENANPACQAAIRVCMVCHEDTPCISFCVCLSIRNRLDKENVAHRHHGILCSHKKG
ncbi:Gag polyprotein [Plecturocebus cupreus]